MYEDLNDAQNNVVELFTRELALALTKWQDALGKDAVLSSETDIARYHNFKSQYPMVCKAGTIAVAHHGIWHCAQPNLADQMRYMFKLRLNPTVRQLKLWNTDDLDDPEIPGLLNANHSWYGNEVRLEVVNRIKFWRFLTGDETFDVSYWLSRLENEPRNKVQAA